MRVAAEEAAVRSRRSGSATGRWCSSSPTTTPSRKNASSPRDEQVMQLLAAGKRDVDIALIFEIGVRTELGYLDRIRDKTGERRRPDLVKTAV